MAYRFAGRIAVWTSVLPMLALFAASCGDNVPAQSTAMGGSAGQMTGGSGGTPEPDGGAGTGGPAGMDGTAGTGGTGGGGEATGGAAGMDAAAGTDGMGGIMGTGGA